MELSLSPLRAICVKAPSLKEVCAQRRHKMTLNDTSVVTGPKKEKKIDVTPCSVSLWSIFSCQLKSYQNLGI